MNSELIRKVQLTQLEIMKAIHKICVDNGIKYYLGGGSALGAVRHQGFIPWDDDLDIVLPRNEYDRLIDTLKEYLPDKYWLQDYTTDKGYWQPFAKVRKRGTVYKEIGMESIDDEKCGVWVDIFPLDYAKKKKSFILSLRKLLVRTIGFSLRQRILKISWGSFSRRYIPTMLFWNLFSIARLKKVQVMAMKGKNDDQLPYLVSLSSTYNLNKETYPSFWFAEGVEKPFEDTVFFIPKEYHNYLNQLFGDYMQLPPVEKRQGHNISNDVDIVL